jgi:hypothetical protein
MTTGQLKSEIQKALDLLPEETLPEVLNFLKEVKSQPEDNVQLNDFLNQTLVEDKELLIKLAQ